MRLDLESWTMNRITCSIRMIGHAASGQEPDDLPDPIDLVRNEPPTGSSSSNRLGSVASALAIIASLRSSTGSFAMGRKPAVPSPTDGYSESGGIAIRNSAGGMSDVGP
jgi:hypothetical protein